MGLFGKAPKRITAHSAEVQTLADGLSDAERRHVRQTDIDCLERSLRPGESVQHISVTYLRSNIPQPIAITSQRIFHFQGQRTLHEFALGNVMAHEVGEMRKPGKGYVVRITGGDDGYAFVAETMAEAIAFDAALDHTLTSRSA
jgi:hypothetical protein